jgi:hypothetical protein
VVNSPSLCVGITRGTNFPPFSWDPRSHLLADFSMDPIVCPPGGELWLIVEGYDPKSTAATMVKVTVGRPGVTMPMFTICENSLNLFGWPELVWR